MTRVLRQDAPAARALPVPRVARADEPSAEVSEPEPLNGFAADVSVRMAPSYALLVVSREGADLFTVTGRHRDDRLQLPPSTMRRPDLALGTMADKDNTDREQARNIRLLMLEWSRHAEGLRDWLERLRAEVGDQALRLVVWDDTGYEVPWEMLYLWGEAGRARGWLGELVPVTRMVTIHAGDPSERWNPLDLGEHVCSGDTVAWLTEDMTGDMDALRRLHPHEFDEDGLLARLDDDTPVALLYLAAHGEFSVSMTKLTLGGLGLAEFDYGPLPALLGSHGVVFMNACHSGRLITDERTNLALFGFAEMFLRKGAASVVGTVGKVEMGLARAVAAQVLGEIVEDPSVAIAEAVRRVRARAAAKVAARRPAAADLKDFVYTFMYVCYGNPYTRLGVPVIGARDA